MFVLKGCVGHFQTTILAKSVGTIPWQMFASPPFPPVNVDQNLEKTNKQKQKKTTLTIASG